jgi:hypothetical protein
MVADSGLAQLLEVCAAYHRDVALASLDTPPGAARETRLAEAIIRCTEVCSAPALAALQDEIDEAPAAQRQPLSRLRAWGLSMFLRGAMLPHRREFLARQRTMTSRVDEELIPVQASFAVMAAESRRERRAAIEAAVGAQLMTLDELFEAQFEALRDAAAQLGYDSLIGLWHTMTGVDLSQQQEVATTLLQETQTSYIDLLSWAADRRLHVPLAQLRRHDTLALFTFPDYQQYYQPGFLTANLQACLQDMDIDPRADGRLQWRQRAATLGAPVAAAVQIPDEIVLSYGPVAGFQSAGVFASACGRALLWAYTNAELPRISQLLGDAAFLESTAQLMAETVAQPLWLRTYARVGVASDYGPWLRLDRLYRLRRQLGRFLYSCHLYSSGSLSDAAEVYRDIMMEACHVDYLPAYYLFDWDWQFTSLAFWRGWSLAYTLLDTLRAECAVDWFRNPESGQWLRQYWDGALGQSVDDLLQRLLGAPWHAAVLAEALCDERLW